MTPSAAAAVGTGGMLAAAHGTQVGADRRCDRARAARIPTAVGVRDADHRLLLHLVARSCADAVPLLLPPDPAQPADDAGGGGGAAD